MIQGECYFNYFIFPHILSKYGNFLGLWQATSYGHRGGIFQVSDLVIMIKNRRENRVKNHQ